MLRNLTVPALQRILRPSERFSARLAALALGLLVSVAAEAQTPRITHGAGVSVAAGTFQTHPVAGGAMRLALLQTDRPEWHFEAGVLLFRRRDEIRCVTSPCPVGRWRAERIATLRTAFLWPLGSHSGWYLSSGIGGYLTDDLSGPSPKDAFSLDVSLGRRNLGWWTGSFLEARAGYLHSRSRDGATLQIHTGIAY